MIITVTPNPLLNYELHAPPKMAGGHRVKDLPWTVGGKGINVARMLKTLGKPALATTFLGGANGRKIKDRLREQGIILKAVDSNTETRVGINLFCEDAADNAWWLEQGGDLEESAVISFLDLLREHLPRARFLSMSGTVPGRSQQTFYRRILDEARPFPVQVFLDATGEPLLEALKSGGFFLKHNRDECLETFGCDPLRASDRPGLAERLRTRGVWGCLITDGPRDVLLWDGETFIGLRPPMVRESSPVGSGDATLAGFLFGLVEGMTLIDAAKWGLAAGSADAACRGPCAAGFDQVAALVAEVRSFGF